MALRNQEIAARLRELRGQKPQTTVADELGVAERTYQNWEAGDAKPSYRNLQRLAEYHGVAEEFILAGEGAGPVTVTRGGEVIDSIPRQVDTPELLAFLNGPDALAQRLDAIEQAIEALRQERAAGTDTIRKLLRGQDERLRKQDALLTKQTDLIATMLGTLKSIDASIATERRAKEEAEAAANELRGLLRALGDANRALLAETPQTAEARELPAK